MSDPRDDFVVSFCSVDRHWAEWVLWRLDQAWFTATLAPLDESASHPGFDEDLRRARGILLIMSPSAAGIFRRRRPWVHEAERLARAQPAALIPVTVRTFDRTDVSGPGGGIVIAGLDEEEAAAHLLGELRPLMPPGRQDPGPGGEGLRKSTRTIIFPRCQAAVWRMPGPQPARFFGHEEALGSLESVLRRTGRVLLRPGELACDSPGLTCLAMEHVYRHVGDHGVVAWIRCQDPGVRNADLAALARDLGLPGTGELPEARVLDLVFSWLADHEDWLLVFDDVARGQDVPEEIHALTHGHVILITKAGAKPGIPGETVSIDGLPREDRDQALRSAFPDLEQEVAGDLIQFLGPGPLAFDLAYQAGRSLHMSASDYRDRLRSREDRTGESSSHRAFAVALESLMERSPEAAELLVIAAYLAPGEIHQKLLRSNLRGLPAALAKAARFHASFDRVIEVLVDTGLAQATDEDNLVVSAAIGRLTRLSLTGDQARGALRTAGSLVASSTGHVLDETASWSSWSRWLPHARSILAHTRALGCFPPVMEIVKVLAHFLLTRGSPAEARQCYEEGLGWAESTAGISPATQIALAMDVASIQGRMGDAPGRLSTLERALARARNGSLVSGTLLADLLAELALAQEAGRNRPGTA